jgi:hypothetical protein
MAQQYQICGRPATRAVVLRGKFLLADSGYAAVHVEFSRAMIETVFNKAVHLLIATTAGELEAVLGTLPHGVRFGVAHQLDQAGEAFRYESARHCAYYLRRHEEGIQVWRWCYIASMLEAKYLQAMVQSLGKPLDGASASRIFEQATRRSVSNPRPMGMEHFALDFGQSAGNRSLAGA